MNMTPLKLNPRKLQYYFYYQKFINKMSKKSPITQYPTYQSQLQSYNHSKEYSKISLESQPSFDSLSWKHQINSVCQIPGTKKPNIDQLDLKYRGLNKYKQNENNWQRDLTKKLMKLREQFKGIPDWQKHVQQILFKNNDKHDNHNLKKAQKQNTRQLLASNFNKEQQSQNFLFDSNLSFKIRQTSTIEQQKTLMSRNNTSKNLRAGQLPVKQFQLYSAKRSVNKNSKVRENCFEDKRVDERIEQIERKIRNCQEQKRKLKIDIPRKSLTPIRNQNKSGEKIPPKMNLQMRRKSYTKLNHRQATVVNDEQEFKYSQIRSKDRSKPPKYLEHPRYNKQNGEITQFGLSPRFAAEPKQIFPSVKSQKVYKKEPKVIQQSDYKKTVEQWGMKTKKQIENRRRIRSQYQLPSRQKKEIRKFINRISQQIKLDEQFKNNKLWLQACKEEQKWKILKKILAQEDINLSIEETKKLFSLNHEEDNPFFSVKSFQSSYQNVVSSFIKSEDYWVDHIYHKFNRESLIDEGFNRLTIDLDKKGYIVLEDIVRFLNMETGTFFRNRDAVTIFKRIANQNRFTYQQLIDTICE